MQSHLGYCHRRLGVIISAGPAATSTLTMGDNSTGNIEGPFGPENLAAMTPMGQFAHWFQEVCDHQPPIEQAKDVALATVDSEGVPRVRMLSVKAVDENGIYIATHYSSPKAKEMGENKRVALVFWWSQLERQVRIQGIAERTSHEKSVKLFDEQIRSLQILAYFGQTSTVIKNAEVMDRRDEEIEAELRGATMTKPDSWGGYLIKPTRVEFAENNSNFRSDRILFRRKTPNEILDPEMSIEGDDGWVIERLMP